jgi:hypothetical protein
LLDSPQNENLAHDIESHADEMKKTREEHRVEIDRVKRDVRRLIGSRAQSGDRSGQEGCIKDALTISYYN